MDTEHIEERLAHLIRTTDELSDIVAEQAQRIARLERQVQVLVTREAERDALDSGGIAVADERPPHW